MNDNELVRKITEMTKETQTGTITWEVKCQTTEYNDDKPVVTEEGIQWTVDECYVSYHCTYKGKEFLLISYEMIHTNDDKKRTTNLIFMPPMGIRFFDIHALLPYAVEADQMLTYTVHMLWLSILEAYKKRPQQISLDVDARTLVIEEE